MCVIIFIFVILLILYANFRCEFYDLHKELVPYAEAWSWQKAIVRERKALVERNQDFSDSLIILQHHPVYTLGTGSSEHYLNFDVNNSPIDLYRTERGGEVTYHGPGQVYIHSFLAILCSFRVCSRLLCLG